MDRLRIAFWNTWGWCSEPQGFGVGAGVTVAVTLFGRWLTHAKGPLVNTILPTLVIIAAYVLVVFVYDLWQAPRRALPQVLTLLQGEVTQLIEGWRAEIRQSDLGVGLILLGPGPFISLRCAVQDKHGDTRTPTKGITAGGPGALVVPVLSLTYPRDWSAPVEGGRFRFTWTWAGAPDVVATGWFKAVVRPQSSSRAISSKDQT